MKKLQIFLLFLIVGIITANSTWSKPSEPMPVPPYTVYSTTNLSSYKVSIYHIIRDGFGWYNDGPYFPDSYYDSFNSDYFCTYSTSTYAQVQYWDGDSWEDYGVVYMNSNNTTLGEDNVVTQFVIRKADLIFP